MYSHAFLIVEGSGQSHSYELLAMSRPIDGVVLVGVGSIVVLFSSIDVQNASFAIFSSALSLVVVALVLVLARTRPRMLVREIIWCHLQDPWPESLWYSWGSWELIEAVAVFLTGWWCIAAGVLTFRGPFVTVGNGFFAAWGCLLASLRLLASVTDKAPVTSCMARISLDLDDAPLSGVLAASVVLLLACVHLARNIDDDDDDLAEQQEFGSEFGIACCSFSLVVVTFLRAARSAHTRRDARSSCMAGLRCACAACLLVLWLFALSVLTFGRAPFTPESGNGYFACWLGFFSAASLTLLEAAAYVQHR